MVESEFLKSRIYTLRGVSVMLDKDLADLYNVETRVLNQAVKRNRERFPGDFMFQLTHVEWESLRSQFVIIENKGRGFHLKYFPYAFTEQGVAMLSGILKSKIAIEINICIMRAFIELRQRIMAQSEYALLKETIHRIESRMDTIEANHLVDQVLSKDVRRITELFDQFQDTHIVIQRPEEVLNAG